MFDVRIVPSAPFNRHSLAKPSKRPNRCGLLVNKDLLDLSWF